MKKFIRLVVAVLKGRSKSQLPYLDPSMRRKALIPDRAFAVSVLWEVYLDRLCLVPIKTVQD